MALATTSVAPYIPLQTFDPTIITSPNGGDSLTDDLNVYYQSGDIGKGFLHP